MAIDRISITILPDGTIKSETDKISPANHQSAEKFLQDLSTNTDGSKVRSKRGHTHSHGGVAHTHEEEEKH